MSVNYLTGAPDAEAEDGFHLPTNTVEAAESRLEEEGFTNPLNEHASHVLKEFVERAWRTKDAEELRVEWDKVRRAIGPTDSRSKELFVALLSELCHDRVEAFMNT